jgi:hypothetical protein
MAMVTAGELALRNPCGQSGKLLQLGAVESAEMMAGAGADGNKRSVTEGFTGYRRDNAVWAKESEGRNEGGAARGIAEQRSEGFFDSERRRRIRA